jgi:hypothetical protein
MTDRRSFFTGLCLIVAVVLPTGIARAEAASVFARDGVAIGGADAVAYAREGVHVAGQADHALRWHGAVWLFSSLANRDAFEMNPRGFAPRFGGYCAYTLSQGALADSDPQVFVLHDGGLYLMRDRESRDLWLRDPARHAAEARHHWTLLRGKD